MSKLRQVKWTDLAIASLQQNVDFIESQWTQKEVTKFIEQLDNTVKIIQRFPELATFDPDLGFRRVLINQHVSLFFSSNHTLLTVLLVWDNRQDPKLLKKKIGS